MSNDHHHHHHDHGPASEEQIADLIELLDLDAEVFSDYQAGVTGLVKDQAAGVPVRRILDLGCGTGNGAIRLAELFSDAEVIAVDSSPAMLARLRAKAADLGLDDRIRTVEADLDGAWPLAGEADLVWMSMALHHLADPKQGLTEIFTALRPGGLLALAELTEPLRLLPDDIGLGQPGLEARCHAAQAEAVAGIMPYLGADWGPLVTGAGFEVLVQQLFSLEAPLPVTPQARRYALGSLRRTRTAIETALSPEDLATLDTLTSDEGPQSVLHRSDLRLGASRTLWIAAKTDVR